MSASPDFHLFDTEFGPHVLLADASRVFAIDAGARAELDRGAGRGPAGGRAALAALGLDDRRALMEPPLDPPLRSLSLAVAQSCNLGCTYCYAQGGDFGGKAKAMDAAVGEAAVRRLFADAAPGETFQLAFLGGEPLAARPLIHRLTELAAELAHARGAAARFAITTNGTLLRPEDGEFFARHRFAVTVSLDGVGAGHDRLRPFKNGRGSYARIIENLRPLLARRLNLSARVTVTPENLELRQLLDGLAALGFRSVGFSPALRSPSGRGELRPEDFATLLEQMIACGREFERRAVLGQRYPFANMASAMHEIHRGTHRPYPCGAGAGYFGVSAEGEMFACHRFVDDEAGAMGHVDTGVDRARQRQWLGERLVDRQEPCKSCWARYLCGGGCHHEVIARGRPACDFIRGWLHYCLQAYVRLSAQRPSYFGDPEPS